MNEIWFNRIIEGTKKFSQVPDSRKIDVKKLLLERLSEEDFNYVISQ